MRIFIGLVKYLKLKPFLIGAVIGVCLLVLFYLATSIHFALFTFGFYSGIFFLLFIASS